MQDIVLRNYNDLPKPDVQTECTFDSDSANVSNAGLVHVYKLPKIGDYAYEFKIWSNTTIISEHKAYNYSLVDQLRFDNLGGMTSNMWEVDCVLNYLESVSLCIDSPESILSQVVTIPRVSQVSELQSQLGMELALLTNLPLIIRALYKTDIYLVLKFNRTPPKYYIGYNIGIIANEQIQTQLKTYQITIPGSITNNNTMKHYNFRYAGGKLQLS